jgi:hypothetical protein
MVMRRTKMRRTNIPTKMPSMITIFLSKFSLILLAMPLSLTAIPIMVAVRVPPAEAAAAAIVAAAVAAATAAVPPAEAAAAPPPPTAAASQIRQTPLL